MYKTNLISISLFFIFLFSSSIITAQQKTIKGKVTDNLGQPIPGVAVLIENSTDGVSTDFDGLYEITAQINEKHFADIFLFRNDFATNQGRKSNSNQCCFT